ncbi:MAG: serine/threonine protein kinase [Planctomycetaceae bacterium]|nr:serine/threonine protein kinase [Planctomycetaceae bacterium]
MHRLIGSAVVVLFVAMVAADTHAEDWPGWRGVRGDGTSLETDVPLHWSDTDNVAWKIAVPHAGHSSPVVWGDRLFLLGNDADRETRFLTALDRMTGMPLWERAVLKSPLERKHPLNSFASSTPVTDGELVYVSFLDGKQMFIAAYDFNGNERWQARPGEFASVHGYCSSPVLFEDKVIVNGDHDGDAYLVALSRASGETLWKTPRENKTRSYCTPIIREIDGRMQLLLSGNKCVASYDPRDGSRHWIVDGPTEQLVASLVYSHDLLFVTGGFPEKHVLAINPFGKGDITASHIVWRHRGDLASYVPSPVAVGDYFLVASDSGFATCLDAVSGKIQWSKRLSRHYSASLVSAGGHVYFLDDEGVTTVVKPGPEFETLAVNELHDQCFASPAISHGQLFIRSEAALYCIGKPKAAAAGN